IAAQEGLDPVARLQPGELTGAEPARTLPDDDLDESVAMPGGQRIESRHGGPSRQDSEQVAGREAAEAAPRQPAPQGRHGYGEAEDSGGCRHLGSIVATRHECEEMGRRGDGPMVKFEGDADGRAEIPGPAGEVLR